MICGLRLCMYGLALNEFFPSLEVLICMLYMYMLDVLAHRGARSLACMFAWPTIGSSEYRFQGTENPILLLRKLRRYYISIYTLQNV